MQRQSLLLFLILSLLLGAIALLRFVPLQLGLDLRGGAQLTIAVNPVDETQSVSTQDLDAVKRVIQNRVDALGVAEPQIQTAGSNKVLVQLSGVTDPEQAERVLGGTAQLEFRIQKQGTEGIFDVEYQEQLQLRAILEQIRLSGDAAPEDVQEIVDQLQEKNQILLDLTEGTGLTGTEVEDARPQPLQAGLDWEVALRFDRTGGELFAEATKNIAGTGRRLGIFLDDTIISAASVSAQYASTGIVGGQAVISGGFDLERADDLAVQIRGGSLPFPVEIVENRTVGATLGQNSIRRSIYAAIAGLVLVLIFVAVYYRLPGMIADIALIIYAILTLACYALVGVTLTLPGIAGFILSIGMAVDANVLIFERTREELRSGKSLYRSVESGFYRAFSSILDSNITTLIACAALFWLGSGLVKGFALTLAIGVLVSMFTALTCSRTLLLFTVLNFNSIRQKPELFCPNLTSTSSST
ncbi:MAG: protein translocase subunit SecD [Cyanobacteria bacterium P01_H01_bin.15]